MLGWSEKRLLSQLALDGFRNAEVDYPRHRHAILNGDQDVRGLDVPVNDSFLVRVLNGMTNLNEQVQPLASV